MPIAAPSGGDPPRFLEVMVAPDYDDAALEILTTKGELVAILADRPARENRSLYTTFDREFQRKVQAILGERLGAFRMGACGLPEMRGWKAWIAAVAAAAARIRLRPAALCPWRVYP